MILIDKMSYGRFGNQVLFFNNLVQLAAICETDFWCAPWAGDNLFLKERQPTPKSNSSYKIMTSESLKSITNIELKDISKNDNIIIREPCLGELFFRYDSTNLNNMYKFKDYDREGNTKIAALHFRGTDFHQWNPSAVLPFEYYVKSIEHINEQFDDVKFKVFTDDMFLESFQKTLNYFNDNSIKYFIGPDSSTGVFMNDFIDMSLCDIIVSTPSTFSICAGFLGKRKYIIHNKKWVKERSDLNDKFWKDLYNGGNKNYSTDILL